MCRFIQRAHIQGGSLESSSERDGVAVQERIEMGAIIRFRAAVVATLAMAAIFGVTTAEAAPTGHATGTYSNPLTLRIPGDGLAESCADPDCDPRATTR
jgi:hypothetical protein